MYGVMPEEFYRQYREQDKVDCRNGAYQGSDYWEGEMYADAAIYDKKKWREKIETRIKKIKWMRKQYLLAKSDKRVHTMRMLEEDINKLKQEIRTIVYSRDYEF